MMSLRTKENQGLAPLWMRVLRGARCGNSARRDLRGGHRATGVPTSIGLKLPSNNMKTIPVAITLALAGIATFSIGRDISEDKIAAGKTVERQTLTLDRSQQEEIETLGSLTLTHEQWKALREIDPSSPKRFNSVMHAEHQDCKCCYMNGFKIVQTHPDKVVIERYWGDGLNHALLLLEGRIDKGCLDLYFDSNGNLFHRGRMIPFEQIDDALKRKPRIRNVGGRVSPMSPSSLDVWWPVGVAFEDQKLRAIYDRLVGTAKQAGWGMTCHPFSAIQ